MSTLRITLRHANLLQTPCALLFIKHIQGTLSAPEAALDAATGGELRRLYSQHEREDHEVLETSLPNGPERAYIVNFHAADLPFSYRSVDRYARTILRVSAKEGVASVATAVHGPGAGLDASEALEVLVVALSSE